MPQLSKLAFLVCAACLLFSSAKAADPVLSGTTMYLDGQAYKTLDGVQVTVMRKSPVASDVSKNNGKFSFEFAAGTPVHVLFEGPDGHVPQLQSLGARDDLKHDVHVTLFTVEEARKRGINVYAYVKAIFEQLEAAGADPRSEPMQRLRGLMGKLG